MLVSDIFCHDKTVIFLHIPKTAGSTLHGILNKKYTEKKDMYSISHGLLDPEAVESFKKISNDQKSKLLIVKGHVPFGIHQYLPRKSIYITLIRNPIERMVSYYFYLLRTPDHVFYTQGMSRRLTLHDFAERPISVEFDNGQTRLLAGIHQDVPFGKCSFEHLKRAKRNIDRHFAHVGLTEKFDESLFLLKPIFNWRRTPLYVKRNVSKRPSVKSIPKGTIRAIEKRNQFDIELYQYAKDIFEKEMFNRRSRKFFFYQLLNKGYQIFHNAMPSS